MIHLPGAEREKILRAIAVSEERADKSDAYNLSIALLAWLRAELTAASTEVKTRTLNIVIKEAKEILP
jgi:hypothetical protein